MKKICIILIIACCLSAAYAQGGRVAVSMDDAASRAINAPRSTSKVSGYRICIFSDNSQTGRAAASTAVAQLRAIAPGVPAEVSYENPFFKAYAGVCLNRIEATRLLGRLRGSFPRAVIVSESFQVSNFGSAYEDALRVDTEENSDNTAKPIVEQSFVK